MKSHDINSIEMQEKPSKGEFSFGTLKDYFLSILNARYSAQDVLQLIAFFIFISISFYFCELRTANLIFVFLIIVFFIYSLRFLSCETKPIDYIEKYLSEVQKAMKGYEKDKEEGKTTNPQDKLRRIEGIIVECTNALRFTQIAEVLHLMCFYFILYLFFLTATLVGIYAKELNLDVLDTMYINSINMFSLGSDDWVWGNNYINESKSFLMIQIVSVLFYTIGYVGLFIANLMNMKPQVFRTELRRMYDV